MPICNASLERMKATKFESLISLLFFYAIQYSNNLLLKYCTLSYYYATCALRNKQYDNFSSIN